MQHPPLRNVILPVPTNSFHSSVRFSTSAGARVSLADRRDSGGHRNPAGGIAIGLLAHRLILVSYKEAPGLDNFFWKPQS